jgi:hypothetical protein
MLRVGGEDSCGLFKCAMLHGVHSRARLLAICVLASSLGLGRQATAARVKSVALDQALAAVGSIAQIRVDLDQEYDNPFDPEQVAVDAQLRRPDGVTLSIPGFWTQSVARSLEQGREKLTLQGQPHFAIRFLPEMRGPHKLTVTATDRSGSDAAAPVTIEVSAGHTAGMVRVDPTDPMSLSLQDGTAYVPVGANVDWSGDPSGSYDIDGYYSLMQASRMNWTRLWMTAFGEGWTIEWGDWHPSGYYQGLGRYSLQVASRLDHVFEQAQACGIRIQLVLWQHSQFETAQWSSWSDNPYNAAKAGPAKTSADFFTHPEALRLSRQRLRYLAARYAAFPSLLAWEVMNEMEGVQAPSDLVVGWCDDRAVEMRKLDPYHHLLTTSYMTRPGMGKLAGFASAAYDITQAHNYWGSVRVSIPADAKALAQYNKPLILGEYGLDYEGKIEEQDPKGYHLWEGSWIAFASGFNGGAMSWWWDSYLRPHDLFKTQLALAKVVEAIDLRGVHAPLPEAVIATDLGGSYLDLFGRSSDRHVFFLVRHPDSFWKTANAQGMPEVAGAQVVFPGPPAVLWKARFFDTQRGDLVATRMVQADDRGVAQVLVPAFTGAMAIDLQAQPAQILSVQGGCCLGHASTGRTWGASMFAAWMIVSRRRSLTEAWRRRRRARADRPNADPGTRP